MALPETIPTDLVKLMGLIRATPTGDRYEITSRLEQQIGDQARALRLYGEEEGLSLTHI